MKSNMCVVVTVCLMFTVLTSGSAYACEVCTIPRLGRQDSMENSEGTDKKWFFEFLFEQQNWNEYPAIDAHLLHEDGKDVHNKTTEEFYHFSLGGKISDNLSAVFDLPYVVRNSKNVADGKVGLNDKSEGVGDLSAILNYRVINNGTFSASAVGGIKFATGEDNEKDVGGARFEPELQPGSGSYDYTLGGVAAAHLKRFIVKGNATYTLKTEGSQDFEFGDVFSTSLFIDYIINPESEKYLTKFGIDLNYQFAEKDESNGTSDPDSGGQTLLAGPTLTIQGPHNTLFYGNFLYPVFQNLGGVHQKLDFVWTAGGKFRF